MVMIVRCVTLLDHWRLYRSLPSPPSLFPIPLPLSPSPPSLPPLSQSLETVVRWSETNQTSSAPPSPTHSSTSSLSSDEESSRPATPSLAQDTPGNHLPHPDTNNKPNLIPLTTSIVPQSAVAMTTQGHQSLTNGHMRGESIDESALMEEEEKQVPFCDCPPDPEIPRYIVLHQLRSV